MGNTAMLQGLAPTSGTEGNQITCNVGGSTYTLTYDQENRLVSVTGAATATFYYDGDIHWVKGTIGGVTTTYIGSYFELDQHNDVGATRQWYHSYWLPQHAYQT